MDPNSFHASDLNDLDRRERWQRIVFQQPSLFLLVAAIAGIVFDAKVVELPIALWFTLALTSIGMLMTAGRWPSQTDDSRPPYQTWMRSFALLAVVASLAVLNHRWQDRRYADAAIATIVGPQSSPSIVEGIVDGAPVLRVHPLKRQRLMRDQSPWQTQLTIAATGFRSGQRLQPTDGNLRVTVNGRCDHYLPGDVIRVYGDLYSPRLSTNPGGSDRLGSDRRLDLHGRMNVDRVEQVTLIESGSASHFFSRTIASLASRGRDTLLSSLSESTGPLAVALVIGQRDFVDDPTRDLLLVTGTAHLLSVSGMHLAIVVTLANMIAIGLRMPLFIKVAFLLSVCVFYTAITGARPPVMRAALLVGVFTAAMLFRRPNQPMNTLALAGLFLLFYNPENTFSMGVQLSFLAVATLLFASGRTGSCTRSMVVRNAIETEKQFELLAESAKSGPRRWWRNGVRVVKSLTWLSACVTAISLPLVWHQFNIVSPISVLANVVLGPFLFLALALGITTSIAGIIHPSLAVIPGMGCDLTLTIMRWIIQGCASVPAGHAWLPAPPDGWVIAFYVVLAITLVLPSQIMLSANWWRRGWVVVWITVALVIVMRPSNVPESTVETTFVDVGHGTSCIVRMDDQVWLYDCGRLGNEQGNSRGIDQTLWSMNIHSLDGIILSHADADHFNALPGILRRFRVSEIVTPPGMLAEPESALDEIRLAIAHHSIPVRELSEGMTIATDHHDMRVLHPPAQRIAASDNANSMVLKIDHGAKSLILPGDLEPPGTEVLVNQERPPPGGVLMAPHHGSLRMDAEVVLQWARPAHTIVSGGRLARRPEVETMLRQSGSDVDITSVDGAIRVRMDASGKIDVRSWLRSPW